MISFTRRDIGWKEINEQFTRWELRTPWFGILLHRMDAPVEHQHYHDHPWSFLSIVLWGGYEEAYSVPCRRSPRREWRGVGSVRFRRAEFAHKTTTYDRVSWSLCFTGPKRREWRGDIT